MGTGKEYVKKSIEQGILWIFGSSIISQICGFISSIVVIRHLAKVDYGFYVDASNIYGYVAVFAGMGLTSAILQYCSEVRPEEEKNMVYKYSLQKGSMFNIILIISILALAFLKMNMNQEQAAFYLALMCLVPFFSYFNSYIQVILRVKRKNKHFACVNIIYSIFVVFGNICFTLKWGVTGLIFSIYLSTIVSTMVGLFFLYNDGFLTNLMKVNSKLPKAERTGINNYSLLCSITNFSSNILVLLDITCINIIINDAAVLADYKVGSILPSACMFVPTCLITFFYPDIVEKFSRSINEFIPFIKKIVFTFCSMSIVVSLLLFILAPFLIGFIYGEKYLTSVGIMRILCINFMISAGINKLMGNLIAAFKQVHVNLIFSVIAGITNIVLDVILITMIGSEGAAIATLIITCLLSVMECMYVLCFLRKQHKIRD